MLLSCSCGCLATPVHATLNIEIFGGGATQIPIAIVPLAAEETLKQSITPVVAADLQRSGLFRLVDPGGLRPHEPVEVIYPDWMNRGPALWSIGSTTTLPGGQVALRVKLLDVAKQSQLAGYTETVPAGAVARRGPSHRRYDL